VVWNGAILASPRYSPNPTGFRTLVVDPLTNRISGSGYDAAGSMTSWGDYSYAYYPTNEMKQMIGDGRTTLFGYSADGERVGSYDSVAEGITYVLRGLDNKPLRQHTCRVRWLTFRS
jgi:hypothetical protein